jgi:hypothetical protein
VSIIPLRNGANIDGATSATYTTIAADVGQKHKSTGYGENLLIQGLAKPETIRIFNLKGNMLMNRTAMPNESISISHLPKGMYLVNIGGRTFKFLH